MDQTQGHDYAPRYDATPPTTVTGWAAGGVAFAATLMALIGSFQVLAGLVAIVNDDFHRLERRYTLDLDVTTWGWIHLVLGLVVAAAGFALFAQARWAGVVTLVVAVLTAVANFFFLPYYPFWSMLVIALCVWVVWAVTRPGVIRS
jgi:hypothetical protein